MHHVTIVITILSNFCGNCLYHFEKHFFFIVSVRHSDNRTFPFLLIRLGSHYENKTISFLWLLNLFPFKAANNLCIRKCQKWSGFNRYTMIKRTMKQILISEKKFRKNVSKNLRWDIVTVKMHVENNFLKWNVIRKLPW